MAFQSIAYGPDELFLLTIDGVDLLAYDAQSESPKWQLAFEKPLVAVLYADTNMLPGCQGQSPWRSQASARSAVVVDVDGKVHAVDVVLGTVIGALGPFGKPFAVAASPTGAVALAAEDRVLVWDGSAPREIAIRASAIGFSTDGASLAVGTARGEVHFVATATGETTGKVAVRGAISAVLQHPSGAWLTVGEDGAQRIEGTKSMRIERLPVRIPRALFDTTGESVIVQRSETSAIVYAWPTMSVTMRIEYTERRIRGLAIGPARWLGIGLDRGDANKIDVPTSDVRRMETHPGREYRSWTVLVEGPRERAAANDIDELRKMKSPAGNGGGGARAGIGLVIGIGLLVFRVALRSGASSPSYPTYMPPPMPARCDKACATERVEKLETECKAKPDLRCAEAAVAVHDAMRLGDCPGAKAALKAMTIAPDGAGTTDVMAGVYRTLAESGIDEACALDLLQRPVPKTRLVRLGASGEPTFETLAFPGEEPRTLWVAPDGTTLVGTISSSLKRCLVHRRTPGGSWRVAYRSVASCASVAFFGRSASEVYVAAADAVVELTPTSFTDLGYSGEDVTAIGGITTARGDLFAASHTKMYMYRRHAGTWSEEKMPPDFAVSALAGSSSGIWARSSDDDMKLVLLQRGPSGWSVKPQPWKADEGTAWWIGVDGQPRAAPTGTDAVWVRSSTDLYGSSASGISRFDGKTWTEVYDGSAIALAGTPTDVYALVNPR